MQYINILLPFVTAFLSTALVTPITIFYLKRFGLMDDPKLHKHPGIIHSKAIPRGGGIPLFIGAFVAGLFFLPKTPIILSLFVASVLALCIGIIDDKLNAKSQDVSPYLRFLINILCAIIVVGSGVSISFITNPFGGIFQIGKFHIPLLFGIVISVSQLLSILWIVWVMNMLNWSKGVDGQMPGIVAISAITIGLLSLRFATNGQPVPIDATLSFIIAGVSIGFLLFNFYPAKIFPGYGATFLYLLLAVVSILSSAKLATAILVMGVPIVDAIFTILRRIFHKKSIFFGDKQHLHHLLLTLGLSQRKVALFYWTVSAILGLISLTLQSKSKLFAIIMLVVIVSGGLLFLHRIVRKSNEKNTT